MASIEIDPVAQGFENKAEQREIFHNGSAHQFQTRS
jgi:hypothetical protein